LTGDTAFVAIPQLRGHALSCRKSVACSAGGLVVGQEGGAARGLCRKGRPCPPATRQELLTIRKNTMGQLTFMMGKHEAHFPADRQYARNHMWALAGPASTRFGLTAYAVRLLLDVYFLEWSVAAGSRVALRQPIGSIESKKAESELYAPADGYLSRFNEQLLDDPSLINADGYGEGWLLEMQTDDSSFMSPQQYLRHLEAVWKVAQQTIKGQSHA